MLETRNFQIPERRIDPVEFQEVLDFLDGILEAPILLAAMARDHGAFSYRDFLVGCTVCYRVEGETGAQTPKETIRFSSAANFKKGPGPKNPKTDKCAEREAILRILHNRPKFIAAIYTVSKEAGVDSNEIAKHDILHPCAECRDLIRKLMKEGLISPATRLVNVKDNGKFWKREEGPFDIEKYAKTYTYEKMQKTTVGDFLVDHIPEDVKIVAP